MDRRTRSVWIGPHRRIAEVTFHESVRRTAAPPSRVWQIWSDAGRWPEWNPDVAEMAVDGPFTSGAKATMRTRAGRTHRMHIVEVVPSQRFVMETSPAPGMRLRFRCTVGPDGDGARIAQGVEMGGALGSLAARRAAPRIAAGFEPILAALAARAEKGTPS
jgi:uncharacterized protein YndB with AHSA1/START domain